MSKINLPAKQFSQFIQASIKWLAKTADYKAGLDVSIHGVAETGLVTMSVGADSSFLKVSFKAEEAFTEDFSQIFLDLGYLAQLPLDQTGIVTLTKQKSKTGKEESTDKRLAVSYNSMNFKVPLKSGDIWDKNNHDFESHEITTFVNIEGREVFDAIYTETDLPSSFGLKVQNLLCFHKKPQKEGVFVYAEDGFGAFCHQFKTNSVSFSEGSERILVLYDFFLPITKIMDLTSLKVYSSDRYTLGSMKSTSFESFHWIQPKLQRIQDDLEEYISQNNNVEKRIVEVNTKEFMQTVKNATVFFKPQNMKDTPLQFTAHTKKYSVAAALPSADTLISGVTLTEHELPVFIFFHAGSLRDYLSMMDMDKPCRIEKFTSRVHLIQDTPEKTLLYMIPVVER